MSEKYLDKTGATYFWSKIKTLINSKAEAADLTLHTSNTTEHITASERTAWNEAAGATVASEAGANGLRYYNGVLQVKSGNSWVTIPLDGFPLNQ